MSEPTAIECGFLQCYSHHKCTNPVPCPEHSDLTCKGCGDPAIRGCSYLGQFVCGVPLCATCEGTEGDSSKGLGWGFIGHKHKPKGTNHDEAVLYPEEDV